MDMEKVIKKAERIMCSTVDRDVIDSFCEDVIALLEEQEDLGTELTNAIELIHKKNERIKKLEEQIETLTKWRMNAGAFD